MAYLVKADYSRLIAINLLDDILEQASENSGLSTATILDNGLNMAIAEIKAYLNKLFDMTTEFAKTTGRNENIMRVTIHITLYNLHFTINPHDIPEMRQKIYNDLKKELEAVRDGVLDWELTPRADDSTAGMHRTELFSARKFISKPFTDPQLTSS